MADLAGEQGACLYDEGGAASDGEPHTIYIYIIYIAGSK
jgi:hypothetical protein